MRDCPYLSWLASIGVEVIAVKELIAIMAKALVAPPDQVQVIEIAGEHASVIELRTAKEDIGKVIGKRGRNAQANAYHLERCLCKAQETRSS